MMFKKTVKTTYKCHGKKLAQTLQGLNVLDSSSWTPDIWNHPWTGILAISRHDEGILTQCKVRMIPVGFPHLFQPCRTSKSNENP